MASLPSRRIRKVVNYAALDQDTDISDEDEFAGFLTSTKIKAQKLSSPVASSSGDKVVATNEKLRNKIRCGSPSLSGNGSTACSEEDDALESSGGPAPRSSLQDRVFQRDLAAALELSKRNSGPGSVHTMSEIVSPPLSTSTPKEVLSGDDISDVQKDLTSKKIGKVNPGNRDEETLQSSPHQFSLSDVNKENVREKENISLETKGKPNYTQKVSKKKLDGIDSDDDFSPVPAARSSSEALERLVISPKKDGSNGAYKRRIDAIQKEVEGLAAGKSKRIRQKVSFTSDSSSGSENEWAESEEEDVDDLSEDSDYEESSPKAKKSKKEVKLSSICKPKEARSNTVNSVVSKDVKPFLKITKLAQGTDTNSFVTPVASSREALTLNCNNIPEKTSNPRSKIKNIAVDTNPVTSNKSTSKASKAPATAPSSVAEITSSVPKPSIPSPRPGLARAAFKSPAIAAESLYPNSLVKVTTPSVGLRLGLSRRVSVKSLHPNASLK